MAKFQQKVFGTQNNLPVVNKPTPIWFNYFNPCEYSCIYDATSPYHRFYCSKRQNTIVMSQSNGVFSGL